MIGLSSLGNFFLMFIYYIAVSMNEIRIVIICVCYFKIQIYRGWFFLCSIFINVSNSKWNFVRKRSKYRIALAMIFFVHALKTWKLTQQTTQCSSWMLAKWVCRIFLLLCLYDLEQLIWGKRVEWHSYVSSITSFSRN